MKVDVQKQIAIVTNAAKGIGKAIAKVLLENGAIVFITDVVDNDGEKTARELGTLGKCHYFHTDVRRVHDVDSLITVLQKACGRIDILINNQAIEVSVENDNGNWDAFISAYLSGAFYCCKAAAKVMMKQKAGRIVNIGSVLGNVPMRNQVAFMAANAGLHNMTKALAIELGMYGICVNGVAAGAIAADSRGVASKQMLSHTPLSRFGLPEEVANAVLFLCGQESSYITGHVMSVDGGWSCGYHRDF